MFFSIYSHILDFEKMAFRGVYALKCSCVSHLLADLCQIWRTSLFMWNRGMYFMLYLISSKANSNALDMLNQCIKIFQMSHQRAPGHLGWAFKILQVDWLPPVHGPLHEVEARTLVLSIS